MSVDAEIKKNPQVIKLMDIIKKYEIDINTLNRKQVGEILELYLLASR